MSGEKAIRRGGLAICLAAALTMMGLGCQPAGSSAPATNANKTPEQKPQNKANKQPKPDPG